MCGTCVVQLFEMSASFVMINIAGFKAVATDKSIGVFVGVSF